MAAAIAAQASRVNGSGNHVVRASIAASSRPSVASTSQPGSTGRGSASAGIATATADSTPTIAANRRVARAA